MVRIIAIDPGKNGAIAVRTGNDVTVAKMPETPKDIYDYLNEWVTLSNRDDVPVVAYLEQVSAMPNNGAKSMFTFGNGFGHLQMALIALGIRTIEIRPQKWEKALSLTDGGKVDKAEHKRRLKEKAQRLFPDIKVTAVNQDALLISEYAYLQEK